MLSTTSSQTFYTANSSSSRSSAALTVNTDLSDDSYHYSVISVNSYKSRMNVLYPRRMHPPPATLPPVMLLPVPECPGVISLDPDVVAWEVRHLCEDLLPHSETRLLPAGRVLLGSLGEETDLRKSDEARYCSELFIMLTREILLKDAIGVAELEGPCRILHLTFSGILVKSGAFDTPTTSNESDLRVSCTDTQGPEQFASLLRVIISVMDAFETALNVNAQPASDETHGGHRYKVSLHFSVVKDLTMDQYRKLVMQWLCSRSKGSSLDDESEHSPPLDGKKSVRDVSPVGIGDISSAPVDAVPSYASHVGFTSVPSRLGPLLPQLTASTGTKGEQTVPSFTGLIRRGIAPPRGFIRTHHGAVSQATVTTGVPIEIMRHVRDVLVRMGVEVQIESDYKHRCVRAKKRRAPPTPSGTGLGLRGDPEVTPSPILSPGELASEPVYGDPSQDLGVEVRFYVELTKLESSLKDTYSIDIRRLKGHLRSYKFLYDYITQHLELQR